MKLMFFAAIIFSYSIKLFSQENNFYFKTEKRNYIEDDNDQVSYLRNIYIDYSQLNDSSYFNNIRIVTKNRVIVERDNKEGVVDLVSGQLIIPCFYNEIYFEPINEIFSAQIDQYSGVYNYDGIKLFSFNADTTIVDFAKDLMILKANSKYALANFSGQIVLPFKYASISFSKHMLLCEEIIEEKSVYSLYRIGDYSINLLDKKYDDVYLTEISKNIVIKENSLYGLIDAGTGKELIKPAYKSELHEIWFCDNGIGSFEPNRHLCIAKTVSYSDGNITIIDSLNNYNIRCSDKMPSQIIKIGNYYFSYSEDNIFSYVISNSEKIIYKSKPDDDWPQLLEVINSSAFIAWFPQQEVCIFFNEESHYVIRSKAEPLFSPSTKYMIFEEMIIELETKKKFVYSHTFHPSQYIAVFYDNNDKTVAYFDFYSDQFFEMSNQPDFNKRFGKIMVHLETQLRRSLKGPNKTGVDNVLKQELADKLLFRYLDYDGNVLIDTTHLDLTFSSIIIDDKAVYHIGSMLIWKDPSFDQNLFGFFIFNENMTLISPLILGEYKGFLTDANTNDVHLELSIPVYRKEYEEYWTQLNRFSINEMKIIYTEKFEND
jgi:hypothetical protein